MGLKNTCALQITLLDKPRCAVRCVAHFLTDETFSQPNFRCPINRTPQQRFRRVIALTCLKTQALLMSYNDDDRIV